MNQNIIGTRTAKKFEDDVMSGMSRWSADTEIYKAEEKTRQELAKVSAAFNRMVDKIDEMKRQLYGAVSSANLAIGASNSVAKKYMEEVRSVMGDDIDVSAGIAMEEDVGADDDRTFMAILRKVGKEKDAIKRMRLLSIGIGKIDEAIEAWDGKSVKMDMTASRENANENERKICETKKIAIREKIKALKKRRETLNVLFGNTKRSVLKAIESMEV